MTTLFVAAYSSKSVSESKPIPMPKLYDHGQITIICPERVPELLLAIQSINSTLKGSSSLTTGSKI